MSLRILVEYSKNGNQRAARRVCQIGANRNAPAPTTLSEISQHISTPGMRFLLRWRPLDISCPSCSCMLFEKRKLAPKLVQVEVNRNG